MDPCDPSRRWGYFARAGIADDDTNPINYLRALDWAATAHWVAGNQTAWGVGYYNLGTSEELAPVLATALGGTADGQGVEAFYKVLATDTLIITPGEQWGSQHRETVDDTWVLGIRANLIF